MLLMNYTKRILMKTKCGVLCIGTWQRRGYSSLNGCVTTLSIDTGKCLDVEILTKVCRGCQKIEKQTDASKKADMLERHPCKANYQGSAPSLETEGIKRILWRSEETRKLQYTEYFADGDSKAYNEVENAYENIHVEKRNALVMSRKEFRRHEKFNSCKFVSLCLL